VSPASWRQRVDRALGENAAHLLPVEALLGDRADDHTVDDDTRRADEDVVTDPEDLHATSRFAMDHT